MNHSLGRSPQTLPSATNLRVIFNSNLNFHLHIRKVPSPVSSSSFRNIRADLALALNVHKIQLHICSSVLVHSKQTEAVCVTGTTLNLRDSCWFVQLENKSFQLKTIHQSKSNMLYLKCLSTSALNPML